MAATKPTSIKQAIAQFEAAKSTEAAKVVAAAAEKVELYGMCPPIEKMDASLGSLKACKHLSLSTNNIEKIAGLAGLDNLQKLSLGRNLIKKLDGLEPVADNLQQLWISYNQIERLGGIEKVPHLRVLYMSNNKLKDWAELDKLTALVDLEDLLLINNPLQAEHEAAGTIKDYRLQVLRKLPKLRKIDGVPVEPEEREAAAQAPPAA